MHAGCKVVPTDARRADDADHRPVGDRQDDDHLHPPERRSQPVQDDFIGLFPGGKVVGTENGCFAKTFALDPAPRAGHPRRGGQARCVPRERVPAGARRPGRLLRRRSYTKNGRATFPMASLGIWRDPREIGPVNHLLILNRNDNIIPAVARLSREQAAAYFMLGETQGTSAGGAAEEGRRAAGAGHEPVLPVPRRGAGESVPGADGRRMPFDVFLLNTGRVGGVGRRPELEEGGDRALRRDRQGHRRGDDHLGARPGLRLRRGHARSPGIDDLELLQPRLLYERTGRADEYRAWVAAAEAGADRVPGRLPGPRRRRSSPPSARLRSPTADRSQTGDRGGRSPSG